MAVTVPHPVFRDVQACPFRKIALGTILLANLLLACVISGESGKFSLQSFAVRGDGHGETR
jgi:hypothetical protein